MRPLYYLLAALLFAACTSSPTPETHGSDPATSDVIEPAPGVTPEAAVTGDADIDFTGMEDFPNIVEGCSCAVAQDAGLKTKETSTYLFAYNLQDGPGVIGINGEAVEVALVNTETRTNLSEELFFTHENSTYRIETELMDEGESADEVRAYSGHVKVIEKATGKFRRTKVYGDCGC